MMKKALAVGAFALVMALPLVSTAGSINSVFAGSTSGTSTILVGDTISFDVFMTLDNGVTYDGMSFTVTGDDVGALASSVGLGWAGVAHQVTNWSWNFHTLVTTQIDFTGDGFNGLGTPQINPNSPPVPALIGQIITGAFAGVGNSVLIGTVTIVADTLGLFGGGAIMHNQPDTDAFGFAAGGTDVVSVGTATFNVVPEPGTALLMVLGLGGLGLMGRKNRA